MAETDVRTSIYNVVNGVSNVGIVHDYERWAPDASTFLDRFKTTIGGSSVIRGWTITMSQMLQEDSNFGGGVMRSYRYVIRGYFGLDDTNASEKTAMVVVEDVVEALDGSTTFHSSVFAAEPVDIEIFEPRLFGGALCHYAELVLNVEVFRDAR